MKQYDAIIIGFGKGGKLLAAELAERNWKVAIVERSPQMYGGTCVNVGCIPTKTLIHESEYAEKRYYDDYKNQSKLYALAVARKDKLVSFLREKNYENVKNKPNITLYDGTASFLSENTIRIVSGKDETILEGKEIFINTGSTPILPAIDGLKESKYVYTSETLLQSNKLPAHLLVIGGGDGGVAKELIQYPGIESIDVVETDKMFVDVCREIFPEVACGLEEERVHVYYDDGLRFLRGKKNCYDLIINDSTDPFGHTEGLFTKEFYGSCYNALREDGIMVYQHGSPFYDEDEAACRSMHRKVYRSFPVSRVYQAHIPTCPSGYWLFGFASKKYHPLNDLQAEKWNGLHIPTWYYTTNLHAGAFMLPKYVEDLLEEEENNK